MCFACQRINRRAFCRLKCSHELKKTTLNAIASFSPFASPFFPHIFKALFSHPTLMSNTPVDEQRTLRVLERMNIYFTKYCHFPATCYISFHLYLACTFFFLNTKERTVATNVLFSLLSVLNCNNSAAMQAGLLFPDTGYSPV